MSWSGRILCFSMLLWAACTKDQEKPAAAPEPVVEEPAGCPSMIRGSTTRIEDGEDAIFVIVTGADENVGDQIREQSTRLVELSAKNAPESTGELAACVVVLADSTITFEDIPGGAKLLVKPKHAESLAKLKSTAHERLAKMTAAK